MIDVLDTELCWCCQVEPRMIPDGTGDFYDYCKECQSLINIAIEAISIARRIGVPRYGPSSWRDISVQEHLEHASKHVYQARKFYVDNAEDEDHLAHAICRLVMAKALQDDN